MDEMQRIINLGEASLIVGKLDEAVQHFTKAIEVNSQNASLYSRRARAYFLKNEHCAAENDLLKAIELATTDRERADYNYNLGCVLHDKGDTESAAPMWQNAVNLNPARYSMKRIIQENGLLPGSSPTPPGEDIISGMIRRSIEAKKRL
jgi:tetratricopeptide (TPR) repeat protein